MNLEEIKETNRRNAERLDDEKMRLNAATKRCLSELERIKRKRVGLRRLEGRVDELNAAIREEEESAVGGVVVDESNAAIRVE